MTLQEEIDEILRSQVYRLTQEILHPSPQKYGEPAYTQTAIDDILATIRKHLPEKKKTTHKLTLSPLAQEAVDVDGYSIEIDGTFNQAIQEVQDMLGGKQ